MYTSEARTRQTQNMMKSTMNSKKSQNMMPASTSMTSKMNNIESRITMSGQINNRYQSKSKFTVLKNSNECTTTPAYVAKISKRLNNKAEPLRKSNIPVTSFNKLMPATKIVMTPQVSLNKRAAKGKNHISTQEPVKSELVLDKMRAIAEMAIQTNEAEILNHSLIVGDLKIVTPSKSVTDEIDKLRQQMETKKLLKATRKFEEHAQRDEQHLDDLREFLDTSFITRKPHRLRDNNLEEDRKLIESMDELLQRERPKTESITDIRSRIKLKEQELLSLFDHFQKQTDLFGKMSA